MTFAAGEIARTLWLSGTGKTALLFGTMAAEMSGWDSQHDAALRLAVIVKEP
jgi:hypothetical protein